MASTSWQMESKMGEAKGESYPFELGETVRESYPSDMGEVTGVLYPSGMGWKPKFGKLKLELDRIESTSESGQSEGLSWWELDTGSRYMSSSVGDGQSKGGRVGSSQQTGKGSSPSQGCQSWRSSGKGTRSSGRRSDGFSSGLKHWKDRKLNNHG
jgi:hypothetical protein